MSSSPTKQKIFSRYEVFVIAILAILQFTVVLDFMVLSPLGAQLMKELKISTGQFSIVVAAYAISAGVSGFFSSIIADKFDRKKLLMFFYIGFVIGTLLCGIAPTYEFLLGARIFTGIFGGVIGSICFAIITDLFKFEVRGRVMGFVQMAFASSQVLGIPIGLYLANKIHWHAPFIMIVILSAVVGVVIALYLKPIDRHLAIQSEHSVFEHFGNILSKERYLKGFAATIFLATGGFMMMPFASAFSVNNLGMTQEQLPMIYMITGIFSMVSGPLIGKFSDQIGKFTMFLMGTILSIIMVIIYGNLGITPISVVIAINAIMFMGIMSRIISSSALMSAIPEPKDRGSFMGINSAIQQVSGGIAAVIAGMIVYQKTPSSPVEHYDTLAYVVTCTMIVTAIMIYFINKMVLNSTSDAAPQPQPEVAVQPAE